MERKIDRQRERKKCDEVKIILKKIGRERNREASKRAQVRDKGRTGNLVERKQV